MCGQDSRGELLEREKAERGSADGSRVKPIRREWIFLVHESLSQALLSGFPMSMFLETSSKRDPPQHMSTNRSPDQRGDVTEEGSVRGRRASCGESRGGYREGETSESPNPKDGISMK